jgi:hypothetical protein
MRKLFTLFLSLATFFAIQAQTQRTVLVEEFTQASCAPCAAQNPAFNVLLGQNADNLVAIKYQTSWPGVDPMNAQNPDEVQNRVDYYGISGVPSAVLDGVNIPTGSSYEGAPANVTAGMLDGLKADSSAISMELTHELSSDLSTVNVSLTITNMGTEDFMAASNMIRVYMLEDNIQFATAPGSNGEMEFFQVFRKAITPVQGMAFPGNLAPGADTVLTWSADVPGYIYDMRTVSIVAFVQDDANSYVHQAAGTTPQTLTDYVSMVIENTSVASADLCDYAFTPRANVANEGVSPCPAYLVNFYLNGNLIETVSGIDSLAPGEQATVEFTPYTLTGGSNFVAFEVSADNDVANNDNIVTNSYTKLSDTPVNSFEQTIESDAVGEYPAGGIVETPFALALITADDAFLGADNPVGAYAESNNSLFTYFWNWGNVGEQATYTIIDQAVIETSNMALLFDKAYTSWNGSNDGLAVEISTDCGETFTEVWGESGSDLQTAPELNLNNQFFIPTAEDWEPVQIMLDAYEGETIVVKFVATTDWGDNLYIDNIVLKAVTDISETDLIEGISITPNPANEFLNIEINFNDNLTSQVEITNLLGKQVYSKTANAIENINLDITNMTPGVYMVNIKHDNKMHTEKIVIGK